MEKKKAALACLLAIAVAVALTVAWQATRPHRSHTATNSPVAAPYSVDVSIAGDNPAPVGATLYVRVSAASAHPLMRVALYDGSRLVGSARPAPGLAASTFQVPVADPGIHTFVGQVTDATGASASSAPAPVVAAVPRGRRTVVFAALPGETSAQAARRIGLPVTVSAPRGGPRPVQRLLAPPPDSPLPTGTLLSVTVPAAPTNPLGAAISSQPATSAADTALTITAAVQQCTVVLTTTSSDRLEVQHAQSTTGQFAMVGTVTAGHPLTLPMMSGGQHLFEARNGDALGPVVQATVALTCDAGTWSGDVQLRHGLLILPRATDRVYLYLSVNDQPFQRVPATDGTYLSSGAGVTPINSDLPDLDGQNLIIEAWAPPSDPLHHAELIGRGEVDVPSGSSLSDAVGAPNTLTLSAASGTQQLTSLALLRDRLVAFAAHTNATAADRLQWQVLLHPLSQANHDAAPVGMVWSGSTAVHNGSGAFSLNSKSIPQLPPDAASSLMFVTAHGAIGASAAPVGATSSMSSAQLNALMNQLTSAPDREVYVRVLAYAANTSLGIASNVVKLVLPQSTSVNGVHIRLRISSITTRFPAAPEPGLSACVRVTAPWTGAPAEVDDRPPGLPANFPTADLQAAQNMAYWYPHSGTWCPAPQDDDCDFFCWVGNVITSVVDFVAKVWDLIAAVYNGVINFVEDVISDLNPICLAAEGLSSTAGRTCHDLTKVAASAAITAVLTAYGLPASLPTSSEIGDIATGNLTTLAVEYMKDLGIPCDELRASPAVGSLIKKSADRLGVPAPATEPDGSYDVCTQVAREIVGSTQDQIIQDSESQIASADGLPYTPVPGFLMKPEPRGQMQPLRVDVRAVGNYPRNHPYRCTFQVHLTNPAVNFGSLFRSSFGVITSMATPPTGHGPWEGQAEATGDQATLSTQYTGKGAPITFTVASDRYCIASPDIKITGALGAGVVTTHYT